MIVGRDLLEYLTACMNFVPWSVLIGNAAISTSILPAQKLFALVKLLPSDVDPRNGL
jgi:hypothetical protein